MQNFNREIKNIIFDLGGVLLNIDYHKSINAFINLGFNEFSLTYSQARQSELFDLFETGKINETEFFHSLKTHFNSNAPFDSIRNAWNAMLLDLPESRVQFLLNIKNNYRIFLLSNTNQTHQNAFEKIVQQSALIQRLEDIFEKTYYSHHIGLRKPHKEIFEMVLKENNLIPHETLFIDDSVQHTIGAEKAGIKSIFLQKGNDICDLFN